MKLGSCLRIIKKNRKVIVEFGANKTSYIRIVNGMPTLSGIKNANLQLKGITVKDQNVVFMVDDENDDVEQEEIMTPLLSEILVLVTKVRVVRIIVDGKIVEQMKAEYLDREVRNIYCNSYDVLYIEIA